MAFKVDEVFADFRLRFGNAQRDARRIGSTMRNVGRASGAAADAQDRMARSTRRAGRAARDSTRQLTRMQRASRGLAKQFKSMILTLVGIEVARRAIRAVVGTFLGFQERMNNVRAITNATEADFRRLTATAKELGRTTQFTARDAADAMTFLARTGLDVNQTLGVLPGTLNLAAAAAVDLATAADISTNILKGMGLEISELDGLVDVLAKTTNSANVDLFELGEAMKVAAPVAAAAGARIEEVAAVIGILGDAGVKGSLAGTSLRRMLINLTTGAGAAGGAIERLNLQTRDAEGNFVGLTEIFRQLEGQIVTDADLFDLFGARALAAAQVLRTRGAAGIEAFTKSLGEAAGTAERMRKQQMAGLVGAAKALKSAAEGTAIAWGEALAPALTLVADVIRRFVLPPLRGIPAAFQLAGVAAFVLVEAIRLGFNAILRIVGVAVGFILQHLGTLVREIGEFGERLGIFEDASSKLANLGARLQRFGQRVQRGARDQAGINAEVQRFRNALAGAGAEVQEIADDFTGMGEAADDAGEKLGELANQTDTLAGDLARAGLQLDLAQFEEQLRTIRGRLREVVGLPAGTGIFGIQEQLALQRQLAAADKRRAQDLEKLIAAERNLAQAVTAVRVAQEALNAAETDEDRLEATVALEDAVGQLGEATRDADRAMTEFGASGKTALERLTDEASLVIRAVNRIGDAFGLLGDDLRRAIDSALDLLKAVEAINQARREGGGISIGGIAGVVGAGAGIVSSLVSAISGAFSTENTRIIRANTEALKRLTREIDAVREAFAAEPGGVFAGALAILERLPAEPFLPMVRLFLGQLPEREFDLLRQAAAALGIELDATGIGALQLRDALRTLDLAEVFADYSGRLELLRREFELFDVQDPVHHLQQLSRIFAEFTGITLPSFDLTTAAGREQLEQVVQRLFQQVASGELDIAALGGLTLQEFLDALQEMEELLDQIAETEGEVQGETESFVRSSRITEVQGSRLLAQGDTQIVRLTQIRDLLAAMTGGMPAIPPPAPDAIARAMDGTAAGLVVQGDVVIGPITIGPIEAGEDPEALARALAERLASQVDQTFDDWRTAKRRALGLPED